MDDFVVITISGMADCEFLFDSTPFEFNIGLKSKVFPSSKVDPIFQVYFGIGLLSKTFSEPLFIQTGYSSTLIKQLLPQLTNEDIAEVMYHPSMVVIKSFVSSLWFIRDNSISIPTTYSLKIASTNTKPEQGKISHSEIYSNASGNQSKCDFSPDDFTRAAKLQEMFLDKCQGHVENLFLESVGMHNMLQLENRIVRAFMAVNSARVLFYLPAKIGMYVLALECLFTSGSESEITHKISERTAFYLGESNKERLEIYNIISDAYKVRSKYFHGDNPNNAKNTIIRQSEKRVETSQKIDDILRRIFIRIIEKDSALFLLPSEIKGKRNVEGTFGYFLKSLIFPPEPQII